MPSKMGKSSFWMKNTAGEPSMSTTFAAVAFVVTTLAYIGSLFEKIGPVTLRPFDAAACGAYLTPILTLYFSRRFTDSKYPAAPPLPESSTKPESGQE